MTKKLPLASAKSLPQTSPASDFPAWLNQCVELSTTNAMHTITLRITLDAQTWTMLARAAALAKVPMDQIASCALYYGNNLPEYATQAPTKLDLGVLKEVAL